MSNHRDKTELRTSLCNISQKLKHPICAFILILALCIALPAVNAEAAVTLSPEGWSIGGTAVSGSASTLNHANGTGTDRAIIIYVVVETNGTQSITGVTYGNATVQPITTAQEAPGATGWNNFAWLGYCDESCITAATGTTIVATYSNTGINFDGIAAATFTGVDQASPINNSNFNNLAGEPITTTVNNAADNMAVYGVEFNDVGANSITPASNFIEGGEFNTTGNGFRMETGYSATTAAPLTINPTSSVTSNRTTIVAASLNAASIDGVAPSSSITNPANSATLNSASPSSYTVSGSATDNIAVSSIEVSINGAGWQAATCSGCPGAGVTWTYPWTLPADGPYTIQSRATDSSSNVEIPAGGSTVTVDRTAPTVANTSPVNNATGVFINTSIIINWNEDVDCTTVNTANVTIDSGGLAFSSCSANQALFITSGQGGSALYTVTISTGVTDAAGNSMSVDYMFSYTTADQTGQELVRNPEFNTDAEWSVNLESTESGSGFFQHGPSKSQTPDGSGSMQAHEEGRTFTVQGTVTQDVFAPAGSTIDNVSIWSEHITSDDTTGDIVEIELRYADPTIPADGEMDVPLNSNVTINFGEDMDCATIDTASVTISSGGWALSGCTATQAVFITGSQTNNTTYTVTVTTAVTDAAGNALVSPYVFSYTTIP